MPFPEHNETFVINDIVLAIPPESISIQKEDLVYQWKTLRNKVSTKVASGNGQNIVNTEIAYKYDDILELQRLILSLRETPFCYVENMYLRETFVPNWALSQKMAFTCTDLVMSPYDGASDVFRVSLKLVWFNYFPYLHNWLYRKEWATKWIKTDKSKVKYSIGWDIDEKGIRAGHRFNVVEEEMNPITPEFSIELDDPFDSTNISNAISSLDIFRPTTELFDRTFSNTATEADRDFTYTSLYDLMPLPDMMEQSLPVGSPQESFIYKRFLNFRQRDALKKDFGIDVEGDLIDCPNILKLLFSTYWNAQGEPFVLSLHLPAPYDIGLPTYEVDVYNSLRADWIQKILSFNSNITFSFNVYQTVLLPSLIKPRVEGILNGESYSGVGGTGQWIYNAERTRKYGVRTFMHNEAGFHYPLGNNMAEPYTFGHSIGSRHEPRSDATYGGNTEKYRFHTGFDLGKEGDTFFAVKPGVVSRIQDRQAKEDLKWKMTSLEDGKLVERDIYKPADYIDLFEAVRKYLFNKMKTNMLPGLEIVKGKKDGGITQFTAAFKKTKEFGYFQIGLFLQSPTHRDRVYFLDSKSFAGRLLTIKHHDETIANYYHWKSLRSGLAVGDRVDAGEFLGNVGDASTIDSTKGFYELRKAGTDWIVNNVSDVPHHLHFEYWEPRNLHPERNPVEDDSNRNIPTYFLSSMEDYINVDWSYLQQKWPNDFQVPDGTQDGGFVKEELKREIEVVKDEVKEEANSEALAALEKIVLLIDNDWTYYNKASDVRNVWQKQLSFTIEKSNTLDVLQQDYLILEGLVFSNFVAGFNNIVSSIPILDHEFPTHQFLGATEPFYNLEFYGIDNRIWADASFLFEGLGDNAVNLERVRQLLLENSIGYRKIPNSWTCSVDTFITRLFGTYSYPDMLVDEYVEDGEIGIDVAEMKKRAAITRVSSETLAESPGTSRIMMDILETNNFDQEVIVNQGLTSKDMDARIEKVLKKLYEFTVDADSDLEAALAIAKLLDVNLDILNDDSLEIAFASNPRSVGSAEALLDSSDTGLEDFTKRIQYLADKSYDGAQYDIVAKLASGLKNSPYLQTTSNGWVLDVAAMRASASAETLSRLSALDYNVLTAYVDAVRRATLSAELSIAEDRNITSEGTIQGESLTKGEFQAILYNLPVEGKLFRTLYKYFTEISERSGTVSSAFNLFTSAESTLIFTDEKIIHDAIANNNNYFLPQFADNKEAFSLGNLGYFNFTNAEALAKITQTGGTSFGLGSLIYDLMSATPGGEARYFANEVWEAFANDPSDKAIMDSWVASINVSANDMFEKMRKDYILTLPLYHVALEEYVSSAGLEVTNELLGGITESLFGLEASTSKMLGAQIETFMRSSGLLAPSAVFRSKPVFYPPDAQILRDDFTTDEINQEVSSFLVAPLIANLFNLIDRGEMSERANLNKPGSPFVHIASKEEETAKASTYRTVLARIALQVLNNAAILRFLGLEDLYYSETNLFKKGREAYPDLNLPPHPYYRSAYNTYPDFYMWNMYEDGDMYNTEVKKEISKAVHISVQRAFDSIKKLGDGVDARKITGREEEGKLTDSASLADLVYNAEGDVSSRTPFYSPVVGEQPDASVPLSNANLALVRAYTPYQKTPSVVLGDEVISNKIPLPPLSVTEGPGAKSISPLYPSRVGLDKYDELQVEYDKIDTMFGSRAGYLNNKEGYTKKERLDGLALPHDADPNHNFDVESLKLLADQSCMDLFGHKRRLARAIPTFKLYIVEEDQQENRLLNFDDFYSYNGVKEFTIVRSKKSAADHCSITLQNVSGSLDGSKRNAIADADYFSNPKLPIGDDPTTIGTDKEQSFDSVVLRTGLNVQLRVGYSNDPDLLEVMISGRIVDLQWNDTGDLCQLLVQSFGTELTQLVKNSEETFYSTHQLLGYLMLQPELMHFGRWEFGKLYQIGEAQDSRLDFFDYEGNSRGHPFGWIDSAYDTVRRHPFVFVGLLGLLSLSDFAPVGGGARSAVGQGVSKVPTFVRRLSKNVLTAGGRFKWIDDFFKAVRGSEELTTEIGREAINLKIQNRIADVDFGPNISIEGGEIKTLVNGVWESADEATASTTMARLRELLGAELTEMAEAANKAIQISKRISDSDKPLAMSANNLAYVEAFSKIDETKALDEGIDLLTSFESDVAHLNWRQMWFSDPWAYAAPNGTYWSGVGAKPIKNIIRNTVLATAIGAGTLTATSVAADIWSLIWSGPGKGPIDAILRYFTVSKISLMLSPQDDNLFPPAPNDYMRPGAEWLDRQLMKLSPMNWGLVDRQGFIGRYLFDSGPFIKKVDPTACEYQLRNTYIWDVFHEMSLRHPGWIYGARPYGTEFRYTMFFGVPSQRYWARGVSNQFVDRSNRIYKALKDGVNKYEYISLYGNKVGEGLTIEQMESTLGRINEAALAAASWSTMGSEGIKVDTLAIEQVYTTTLLREYLTGLRHRFEPFRRYHLFSSETDIVKNGLISSEVAPYNSVDVQYSELKSTSPTEEGAAGSLLVKAHSFIPDYMLKTKVDKYYPNCRGWVMAARYGMGELTHTMKDIYRGEILLLGNPRIRPWDVGVLLDHYNDMVGPLEIEQVVDTFSYETGYLTEIKPSAFVVTNEISSWPVLEGIKTAVLAIKSIEYDRFGMGPKSLNSFVTAPLEWGVGGKFDEDRLTEKVKKAFGSDSDLINPTSKVFGNVGELPETGDNYFGELAMISGGLFGVSLLSVRATAGTSLPLAVGTGLAAAGAGAAAGVAYVTSGDALRDLVGGYAIFLECMKGDSIQVVPLTKNGRPIVSGLTVQDPAVLWKNLRGSIVRVVDDHVGGTRDLLDLWNNYSTYLWRLPDWSGLGSADLDANGINTTANLIGG